MGKQKQGRLTRWSIVEDREQVDEDGGGVEDGQEAKACLQRVFL